MVLKGALDAVKHLGALSDPACQLVRLYSDNRDKNNQVEEERIMQLWTSLTNIIHQFNGFLELFSPLKVTSKEPGLNLLVQPLKYTQGQEEAGQTVGCGINLSCLGYIDVKAPAEQATFNILWKKKKHFFLWTESIHWNCVLKEDPAQVFKDPWNSIPFSILGTVYGT